MTNNDWLTLAQPYAVPYRFFQGWKQEQPFEFSIKELFTTGLVFLPGLLIAFL